MSGSPQPQAAAASADSSSTVEPASTSQEASHRLAEAIDDFLGDLDKKFSSISNEILTRLDDMAERCDRLEQDILLRDQTTAGPKSGLGISEGSQKEGES